MRIFIIISIVIFLISFVTLVVYFILTLIQINRTVKQVQKVFEKVDKNLESVSDFSYKIFHSFNTLIPILFSLLGISISKLTKFLTSIFFGGRKK